MLENEGTESTSMSDEQMDDLIERSESPSNREIPMTAEPKEAPAATETAPTKEDIFEFNANGRQIKGTREQVIRWAQQGIDYPQKAKQLQEEKQRIEQERQKYEKDYSPYKQINDWATKNPQQWEKLQALYNQVQQGQENAASSGDSAALQKLSALEARIKEQILPFIEQATQERDAAKMKQEDTQLDTEIKSIREKYKDLDWDTPDHEGKSLEYRVLEHAKNTQIPTFKAAFLDLKHEDLLTKAQAQAKQSVSQNIQRKNKLGILGDAPTSSKQSRSFSSPKNIKEQSYEDLAREAMSEIRGAS